MRTREACLPLLDFIGQFKDTVSDLFDFQRWEYSPVQRRWLSPDPAGLGAVNPLNPQVLEPICLCLQQSLVECRSARARMCLG